MSKSNTCMIFTCITKKAILTRKLVLLEKVQVGKDQEKAQSERDSHSKNRGGKKTKLTVRHLYETYEPFICEKYETFLHQKNSEKYETFLHRPCKQYTQIVLCPNSEL